LIEGKVKDWVVPQAAVLTWQTNLEYTLSEYILLQDQAASLCWVPVVPDWMQICWELPV